jgi:cytochrome c-type biogenesis protein CcmH/NrfG
MAMTRTNQGLRIQADSRAGESAGTESFVASRYALRAAVFLVCMLVAAYAWCAVRVYRAYRLSAIHDQASLQRAIRLQPRDASNYDLLGQYYMWDAQNAQAASVQFRQVVSLNPYSSSYWLHLAQSENSLGNDSEQANAIEKAIAVDPNA